MTTKTELEARAAAMQAELDAMKKQISTMPDDVPGVWEPKNGDYFYIDSENIVYSSPHDGDEVDGRRVAINNCFRTREEAEAHARFNAAYAKLQRLAGGFVPKFAGDDQYRLIKNADTGKIVIDHMRHNHGKGVVYFRSAEEARKAITAMGDQINDYFGG